MNAMVPLTCLQIIQHCADPPDEDVVSCQEGGRRVIRLPGNLVVKHGFGVTMEEARNQERAYDLVDPELVRIPQVIEFFETTNNQSQPEGYLIMEYIRGRTIAEPDDIQLSQIVTIVDYLFSIRGPVPGSLTGSALRGNLFSEARDLQPRNIKELEDWINRRVRGKQVELGSFPLGLCHLDVAPRNIIWPSHGPPCLIDWESAAFLPRVFESCSHKVTGSEAAHFHDNLYNRVSPLSELEKAAESAILEAWDNSQRFYLYI